MKKLFYIKVLILMIFALNLNAQHQWCGFEGIPLDADTTRGTRKSSNGYWLPVNGELRVLVVFLEMVYANSNLDPSPNGTNEWPAGQLPVWADELFDHETPTGVTQGAVTRYFQDASSGNKILLGDYLVAPDNGGVFQVHTVDGKVYNPSYLIPAINAMLGNTIITSKGYNSIADFDKWTPASQGLPKDPTGNNRWDNVVFIVRNSLLPGHKTGRAGASMSNLLLGYQGDSWSIQCTHDIIPTLIVRHEYAHFLLGDNNFHAGGGGWGQPNDYWIPQVGGWSMLGGNSCSFLSWNAWDRQRMGWKAPGNQFNPSARNSTNTIEVNGDLDATNPNDAGIYTLRDFVITGDAIRIKLPFIDAANEYQQWIWVENRQGIVINNNPFDQWQYQSTHPHCVVGSQPGLGIYIQIDKDIRESNSASLVYGGYAGYIRPLPANGFWDRYFPTQTVFNDCVSGGDERTFQRLFTNSFTGGGDQEAYTWDIDENGIINHDDQLANYVEDVNGQYVKNLFYLGHGEHIFTLNGNNKLSLSGNPSSVPLMNMVSYNNPPPLKPNVRKIYLNGISVEMLHQDQNGNVQVQIRFDDVDITNDVRWCADEIVLNPIPTQSGYSLNLKRGNTITLDQGLTATRMNNPITFDGKQVFASPTVLRIKDIAVVNQEDNSYFVVKNGSNLKLESGSKFIVNHEAELIIKEGSHLYVEDCASLIFLGDAKLIVENGATLELSPNAMIFFANGEQNLEIDPGAIIVPGTLHPEVFAFPSLTISTNVIVQDKVCYIPGLITIEDGASLTLINSTLRFDSSVTRMIVERAAKLVVDNSTLTSACNGPWRGIEVWGNSSLGHIPPSNQGWVQIINGGVIENAVCGIRTSKTIGSAGQEEDVYGYSGGIVQATGAIFRNNRNAVEFLPHDNGNNLSFFRECQFITDAELIDAELPDYFLRFNGVQNIKVQGCSFSNTRNFQETEFKERGNGIFASNSDIILENYCTSQTVPCPPQDIVKSEFSNLYYAIYGIGTGQNRTVKIEDVDFNENIRSVYLSALDFAEVTLSRFNTWPETGQYQEPQSYGLYLDACTGYTVEENTFAGTALPDRAGLGLVINNSGPDANIVYNNLFSDLLYASIAQNSNRNGANPEHGLCYKCNEFINNEYDIFISSEHPHNRDQGIAIHQGADIQGDNTAPAGNIFTIPTNVFDISNGAGPVIYFMHETHNGFNLTPDPVSAGVTVSTVRNTVFSREGSCPSNLGGSEPPVEEEKMMAAGLQADSVYTEIAILVDGGSTDALATTVITTTEPEAPQTQSELIQNSPYLSDSILQTTITREDVFTNPMIYDVMVANPQSGKSEVILDMLEGKTEPMPSYLMADIYDGRLTVSDKEALEAMAGHWIREGFRAYTNLFRMYSSDSIVENLTGLLSTAGFLQARYKLAMFYLGNQQYAAANQVLAGLPLEFALDANQAEVHQKYFDLSSLWQSIAGDSVYFTNPGSSLITDIETLFGENSGIPSVYARNLLVSAKMLEHNEKIIISQELKKARWYDRLRPTKITGSQAFKVYPNPSGTQLWVSIPEDCLLANAIMDILNAEGRKTSSIKPDNHLFMIDTSKWSAGLYLLKLWDGKQWLAEKVLVE